MINADPDAWYRRGAEQMGAEALRRTTGAAIHDPATVHAMCEDYRAGLGVDRAADDADRAAGRRIGCPVLFVWADAGRHGRALRRPGRGLARLGRRRARPSPIDSGHHMAEEAPEALAAAIAGCAAPRG